MSAPQNLRIKLFSYSILSILSLVPVVIWINNTGNPFQYFLSEVPKGQRLYIFSKLTGLYALFMLWIQVMYALLKDTRASSLLPDWNLSYHRRIGIFTLSLVIAHALLFASAVSVRKGVIAYNLFLPHFTDYYSTILSLGIIALWLLIIISITGHLRLKTENVKWPHRLSFIAFCLVFIHGLLVGSETRAGIMLYTYIFIGVTFLSVLLNWFVKLQLSGVDKS